MELNCPNCGRDTEVPGVLIPGARVTTTCSRCGAKFGGTVPARADQRKGGGGSNQTWRGSGDSRPERNSGGKRASVRAGQRKGGGPSKRTRRGAGDSRPKRNPGAKRASVRAGPDEAGPRGADREKNRGDRSSKRLGAEPAVRSDRAEGGAGIQTGASPTGRPRENPGGREGRAGRQAERPKSDRPPLRVVAKGLDAERLANLVASDMLLYNREKIDEAAGQGCLLSSMAAEIVEAWEFYKGRVGEEVAKGTPYFRDAMNGILGGGDPIL